MTTANTDAHNLFSQGFNGLIREDVMEQIWNVSNIPLPFTDSIGNHSMSNQYSEWTRDKLPAPDVSNAAIDGADTTGNDAVLGDRQGNHAQIMTKVVRVSTRARSVNTIGFADTLAYQVMQRQRSLRRDFEAIMLQPQASVRGTDTVAGNMAGFPSWLTTSTRRGTGGSDGGFNSGTGITAAPSAGQARALTETDIRDVAQSIYEQGNAVPSELMSVPSVIRRLSAYMFGNSAQIATLRRDANEMGPAQAQGSVNIFILDFGATLNMVSNRLQQTYQSSDGSPVPVANVFIYTPAYVAQGILTGYRVEPLAKTGLADNRLMQVDGSLAVYEERAHGVIADVNPASAVTAS